MPKPTKPLKLKKGKYGVDILGRVYGPFIRSDITADKAETYYYCPGYNYRWTAQGRDIPLGLTWIGTIPETDRDIVKLLTRRDIK